MARPKTNPAIGAQAEDAPVGWCWIITWSTWDPAVKSWMLGTSEGEC